MCVIESLHRFFQRIIDSTMLTFLIISSLMYEIAGQSRTLNFVDLPTTNAASVGYDFPSAGTLKLSLESQQGGSSDTSFCTAIFSDSSSAPSICRISVTATITNTSGIVDQQSIAGHFEFGEVKFTNVPGVGATTNLFLQTLFPPPILNNVGTLQLFAQASPTAGGSLSRDITFTSGPAEQLLFTVSSNSVAAGATIQVQVSALDSFSNVDSQYSESLTVTIQGSATTFSPQTLSFAAGVATYSFTTTSVQTVNVTVASGSLVLVSSLQVISVNPGPTTLITWENSTVSVPETEQTTLTMQAFDEYGNLNTAESRSITLAKNSAIVSEEPTFVNGVAILTTALQGRGEYLYTMIGLSAPPPGVVHTQVLTLTVTAVCDGVSEYQDESFQISCKTVSAECGVGTFQEATATPTSNRVCIACDGVFEYQDLANQTSCKAMGANCTAGSFASTPATSSSDRVCDPCVGNTYSDAQNLPECLNVTECVAGQVLTVPFSAVANNQCDDCRPGFVDADLNASTACTVCAERLEAVATFSFATLTFAQDHEGMLTVSVSHTNPTVASTVGNWSIRAGTCAFSPTPLILSCVNATNCGDLSDTHGSMADGSLYTDSVLTLTGNNNIVKHAVVAYTAGSGDFLACTDIQPSEQATYTDAAGETECRNVTQCQIGHAEDVPYTYSSDRTCEPCVAGSTFQSMEGERFCVPVKDCVTGQFEAQAPTVSSDRICTGITCPSLDPPLYGSITTCTGNGTVEDYLTECTYSCNVEFAFQPISVTRTCTAAGTFDGTAPTCRCEGSLSLDAVNGRCVSECPDGFLIKRGSSQCQACAATCASGFYESQPCDNVNNIDRICSACSTCPDGFYATGGCDPTSNNDTVCSPWNPCDPGYYETVPGTPFADRTCSVCRSCSGSTSIPLYAAGGCCGTTNTICDAVRTCPTGYFESLPPQPAPVVQGGLGTDRRCAIYRECAVGEFEESPGTSTTDRVCTACSVCDEGAYVATNCSRTSNTGCADLQACADTEYLSGFSTYHDGTCVSYTGCASFEYEVFPRNPYGDSVCVATTPCDPVLDYETQTPTASTNRVCARCSVCGEGAKVNESFQLAPCDTTTDTQCTSDAGLVTPASQCPRGTALLSTGSLGYCVPCDECPTGTYAAGGKLCPHTVPAALFTDPRCSNWSTCPPLYVETVAPTSTTDRVCERCAQCPADSYSTTTACVRDAAELNCTMDPPCTDGVQFEVVAGTPTSARQCQQCRQCARDEFEVVRCSGRNNTVCRQHKNCPSNEALLIAGRATTDAVCRACSDRVAGSVRPGGDLYLCPLEPYPDVCPAPPPPGRTVLETAYARFTFAFVGEYTTTVGAMVHVDRKKLFEDTFIEFLSSTLSIDASAFVNVDVSAGSIVVSFDIQDVGNQTFNDTLDSVQGLINDSFTYTYEDAALTVAPGSISAVIITPSSSSTPTTVTVVTNVVTSSTTAATTSAIGNVAASNDSEDGISSGAVAGIAVAAVVVVGILIALVVVKRRQNKPQGASNTAFNPDLVNDEGDEYLNMTTGEDDNMFDNQVAQENRKLKAEIAGMNVKITEKNAVISQQLRSKQAAERVLEVAVAKQLHQENKAIAASIAAMKSELKKKKNTSKFQRAAAQQVQLMAEKAQLEDEIATADAVSQVALQVVAEQKSTGGQAAPSEAQRIAQEKARISSQMSKLSDKLNTLK
eukprot:m.1281460 g.1281460  ORF g.1281460 m.1281460 type:complete len:1697 (+) comp24771_c0_seq4:155-5245(+)